MKKHGKAKPKSHKGTIGPIRSKRIGKGSAAHSGKKRPRKLARKVRKSAKLHVRKMSVSKRSSRRAGKPKARRLQLVRRPKPAAPVSGQRAADEIPTLEQVTITCANCGRPFKIMKLKGLSLEGTICQRCSLGEMELPESFG